MAVDTTPRAWFGAGYALASSVIGLPTASHAGTSLGTFTADPATDILTTAAPHYLAVGDLVRFTGGSLPGGLATGTDYRVLTAPSATTLTLSASGGGAVIDITDAGSGTRTIFAQGVLKEVTDTEANATTGDIRKVLYGLCERLWLYWNALVAGDRPTRMAVRKNMITDPATSQITASYTVEFVLTPGSLEVTPE